MAAGVTQPTLTDANLILGRLDPDALLAVETPVALADVRRVFAETIGPPLGLDAEGAAAAVIRIANDRMAGAIRMATLARGHDPRDFVLFAFGGAGPMHAAALAAELGIPRVMIPARPGITSAVGCITADLRHDYVNTLNAPLAEADMAAVRAILERQAAEGRATIEQEGVAVGEIAYLHTADMQFEGQTHLLTVPVESPAVTRDELQKAFEVAYWERFAVALDTIRAVLVNLHTAVIGARPQVPLAALAGAAQAATPRRCFDNHAARVVPHRLGGNAHLRPRAPARRCPLRGSRDRPPDRHHERRRARQPGLPRCYRQSDPGGRPVSTLDAITLGVVQSGLQQVCNEMDLAFVRAAFSPVISEGLDRSDGIYAREDGKLIAQGELGLPVFVGTMQFSTEHLIATKPTVHEGDIFAVNDPYLGGTHLMDVRFARPFFYKGAHFAWLSNTGHWPDTGGMVPGGFSARATEVVQEGLRFPPVKLYKEGKIDEEILSIILSNIRVPEQRIGDIEAQSAALLVGARRMTALLDKYGLALVEDVIREMRQRAARQTRAKIETIPDGSYRGLAQVDFRWRGERAAHHRHAHPRRRH